MMTIHDEGDGDKTLWAPEDEPVITEERASKGDMLVVRSTPTKAQEERGQLGDIRFAQVQIRNILNFLWDRGILEAQHVHDGQTYELWHTIFNSRLGYRNNPIYSAREIALMAKSVSDEGFDDADFMCVLRSLSTIQNKLVQAAIYNHASEHHRWLCMRSATQYRNAFDRLSEVMEPLKEAAKKRREEKK
jgi:hypothetical protein